MKIFILLAVLLVSKGQGSPLSGLKDLDKRRESTPEILNLEQELKKAAGEDKQYFSANEARPVPQIDGLATEDESEEEMPVNQEEGIPVDEVSLEPDDDMGGIPGYEEDGDQKNTGVYSQMWNMFRQHPDYFEDVLQDYMNNAIEDQQQSGEYQGVKRDSSGVFPYPADNERMSLGYYPEQDGMYVPSDAQDRSAALMADYFASANQRLKYAREDEAPGGDSRESDDRTEDADLYEPESEEQSEEEDSEEEEEPSDSAEDEDDLSDEDEEGVDRSEEDQSDEESEEDGHNGNGTGEVDDEDEEELDSLHAHMPEELDDDGHSLEQQMAEMPRVGGPGSPIKSKQSSKPWHDIGDVAVPPMPIM